jgi:O-acetyl-ADP-ribose deacetylase (regulator of RNase III)
VSHGYTISPGTLHRQGTSTVNRGVRVRVEIVVGNIVRQPDVDALVNSANANLRFGSGVAGAIHTAAGPELEQYCRRYSPIALGEAVVTPGFELPNPYVIHARAASYINDDHPERYLDLAVGQALRVAKEAGIKTLAMPAIGTGVFKFPPELAAEIIVKALLSRAPEYADITLVRICVGDDQMKAVFQTALDAALKESTRN